MFPGEISSEGDAADPVSSPDGDNFGKTSELLTKCCGLSCFLLDMMSSHRSSRTFSTTARLYVSAVVDILHQIYHLYINSAYSRLRGWPWAANGWSDWMVKRHDVCKALIYKSTCSDYRITRVAREASGPARIHFRGGGRQRAIHEERILQL